MFADRLWQLPVLNGEEPEAIAMAALVFRLPQIQYLVAGQQKAPLRGLTCVRGRASLHQELTWIR
jgi:hypothetical protein